MPFAGVPYNVKVVQAKAASTANVTLTAPGTAIDGVTLGTGDRVLLKDQTAGAENGIYDFNGSAATLTRSPDAVLGVLVDAYSVRVQQGTANAETRWEVSTNDPITPGTTSLAFVRKDWSEEPWATVYGPFGVSLAAGQAAVTTFLARPGAAGVITSVVANLNATTLSPVRIDPADYPVPVGRTAQMRVVHTVMTNATAPAITFTAGLYPVTVAGATSSLSATIGTVVTNSTAAVASPAASSSVRTVSATFAPPTAALYALAVVMSGALAATNPAVHCEALLQLRYV
jgi:hypothetical protein